MRFFPQSSRYRFRPPRPSAFWKPFLGWINDTYYLARKYHLEIPQIEGMEEVVELAKQGHSLLLTPNHADHADAHVIMYAGLQYQLDLRFMAAREIFEESRIASFALTRMGAFSVDRDGPDIAALKTAIGIIAQGRSPLVIFPEGEIFHHHEVLDMIHQGAAAILLRGASQMPVGQRAFLVPVALRYFHDSSVEATFAARLDALENHIGAPNRSDVAPGERLYLLGRHLLEQKEKHYLGNPGEGELPARLAHLTEFLIKSVETRYDKPAQDKSIPERIRGLRHYLRLTMHEEGRTWQPGALETLHEDLEKLFVAFQAYSYPGQYVKTKPSIDRVAESIMKLEEDCLGHPTYPTPRRVVMKCGKPIDLHTLTADGSIDAKKGARPLTGLLSQSLQALLNSLDHPESTPRTS